MDINYTPFLIVGSCFKWIVWMGISRGGGDGVPGGVGTSWQLYSARNITVKDLLISLNPYVLKKFVFRLQVVS